MTKAVLACILAVCCVSTAFGVDGFGVNATGGAGGAVVTVTTPADLKTYAETIDTPYIIQVSGTLDLAPLESKKISIRSNKTIRGIGVNPTIIGQLGFKKPTNNVIIERLNISCPQGYGEGNGLCVKEDVTNVFITKCTIYDCWDGLVDITRRSDWVTVSWCKFYFTQAMNNQRVSLVGNSDTATTDAGKLHITYHHNWFGAMCMQRIPSVRFGKVHVYNNYYYCPGVTTLYGIWSRIQAECLIENNYFKNVNNPYYDIDYTGTDKGKIAASGNVFDACTGTIHPGTDTVFATTYSYTPDAAADVPAMVQWGAGVDGKDGMPPHWYFKNYGDFDRSGLVDITDLVTFAGYWLDTENISDADYDGNGIVDMAEFRLFADNWF